MCLLGEADDDDDDEDKADMFQQDGSNLCSSILAH